MRGVRARCLAWCRPAWFAWALLALLGLGLSVPLARAEPANLAPGLALGVYRPDLPDNLGALRGYEAAVGRPLALVHWYALWGGWKSDLVRADLDAVAARGSVPLITWEPWAGQANDPAWSLQAGILSGAHDAYVATWARTLAAYGRPVLLRFAHEMHDQTYPWAVGVNGNTAAQYVAAWRHVRAIFDQAGATNVQWVWNPNTMPGATRELYRAVYAEVYPGDDQVDWAGLDVYNGGAGLPAWGGWRSFAEALDEPYQGLLAVTGKPVILAEVGSAERGGSKASWIRGAFAELLGARYPAVRALVWFDVDKEERWTLRSSPAAFQAWVDGAHALLASQPTTS